MHSLSSPYSLSEDTMFSSETVKNDVSELASSFLQIIGSLAKTIFF